MKHTRTLSALTAFSMVFATGCGSKANNISNEQSTAFVSCSDSAPTTETSKVPTGYERVPVKDALDAVPAEFAELEENKVFKNLDFSKAFNYVPKEAGDMYELKVKDISSDGCSNEELYELLLYGVEKEFPNSELAKDKQNYFFSAEKNEAYVSDHRVVYPKIYDGDNLEKFKDGTFGKSNFMMYNTDCNGEKHGADAEYLALYSTFSVIMKHAKCRHRATVYGEDEMSLDGWMPRDSFNSIAHATPDDESKFPLDGGELAINEAVKFCEDYLSSSALYVRDNVGPFKVTNVKILKIDENTNAYYMYLSNTYNGIPFATMNFEGGSSAFSDGHEYSFVSSEALISTPNELEYCLLNYLNPEITTVGDKIEKIIPLKKAVEIVSDKLSRFVTLEVTDIRLVYYRRDTDEKYFSMSRPVWCFTAFNPNDDFVYEVYVDVENGSLFYFKHVYG